jgi:Na+-transporting NADH:ubiquinone oxidoreductase subunit C
MVCLGCSILVSGAANGLRARQDANLKLDIRKNILKSVGLMPETATREEVNGIYAERIRGLVVDADGNVAQGRAPGDIGTDTGLFPVFQRIDDGAVSAYTFPISGKGLWSTCYGYFALDSDLDTVRGITFYQHGETPGLGGEIDKAYFQEGWVGKKVLDADGTMVSVSVAKGPAVERHSAELDHWVDGISGATMTCNGVTDLVRAGLMRYEPYFAELRASSGESSR